MEPNEALVAIVALILGFGSPVAALYLWFHRPSATGKVPAVRMDPQLDARLERMEQAIQAIAIETERIAEGQRFTTKLLSQPDRHDRNALLG